MIRPVRVLPVVGAAGPAAAAVAAAAVGVAGPAATPQATGPRLSTALGVRVKVAGERMVGQDVELVATNQPEEDRPVYERLPGDAPEGDDQLFASEDIVEAERQVVEPVMGDATPVYEYEPGTWGPEEADQLIGEGGWSNPAGRERRPR
jgi:Glucose-6-phosphate dehydrogenase, C-terminal domain